MILGVILRNFKIYKSITYIPISNGNRFCGLIGKNGIGKSSILEALDYYFNNKDFKKNNTGNPKSDDCYVVPVFCVNKEIIHNSFSDYENDIITLSDCIWDVITNIAPNIINNNYVELIKQFSNHILSLTDSINRNNYCLIPIGLDIDGNVSLGFFKDGVFINKLVADSEAQNAEQKQKILQEKYKDIYLKIREYFQYVFIPKDIEPENLVRFETLELQTLLNTNLHKIISEYLTKTDISDISMGLKKFVEELSSKLPNYVFRAPTSYQPNLKPDKIYNLIVQDFFSLRQLHKEGKNGGKDLPLKELSSGEKQQAILSLIHSLVSEYRSDNTKNLIIAVDEPESSLHVSACYEQFEKLHEISTKCCQILISSHWYGFIPAIPNGTVTNITFTDAKNKGHIFNIQKYREEIKHQTRNYAQEFHSPLPIDISLKSSNDFIQSILMSVISKEDSYNWLICEGFSDKIYLDAYLREEIDNKKLRIIPVCTASEVKNTYNRLQVLFEELRQGDQLKGRVFLLTDTDSNPVEFATQDNLESNLRCRRIVNVNAEKNTTLVKITANPKAPNTDIEDTLNGIVFQKALIYFKNNGFESILDFVTDNTIEEIPSEYALNLRINEKLQLDEFFNGNNGNNKVMFANKYVEILKNGHYVIPDWILSIKDFYNR